MLQRSLGGHRHLRGTYYFRGSNSKQGKQESAKESGKILRHHIPEDLFFLGTAVKTYNPKQKNK
jgi:hypothetical protein